MALRFVGIDPNTGGNGSPTVWVDDETQEIVIQGWTAGTELAAQCAVLTAPGHAPGIPEGESVVRIPARMVPALREAFDVFDAQ